MSNSSSNIKPKPNPKSMVSCIAENDTFPIIRTAALSDMEEEGIYEMLPIERQQHFLEEEENFDFDSFDCARQKRGVSFGGVSVSFIESSTEMEEKDKDEIWYQRSEMDSFKNQARKLCKQKQKGVTNTSESIRGMDVYFASRQRAHAEYVFYILQAHRAVCAGKPEFLGELAEKWSFEAKQDALRRGIQDSFDAYFPGITLTTSPKPKKKRMATDWEPERTRP